MARSLSVPYSPAPVPRNPDDLPRYLEDEFQRIRQALIAQPVAFSIQEDGTLPVDNVLVWEQILIGTDAEWDVPGGGWDPVTGMWTCPQAGLYQITYSIEVGAFGSGNKNYYAAIAIDISGSTVERYETTDGGDDDIPLGVILTGLVFMLQGALVQFEASVVHENQTGTVPGHAVAQILRVSS